MAECYFFTAARKSLYAFFCLTNQYKEETDLYLQFLNENTEKNEHGHIHCVTLYETFKDWFKANNPGTKIPSNKEFAKNLKKYKEMVYVLVDGKSQVGFKNLKIKE